MQTTNTLGFSAPVFGLTSFGQNCSVSIPLRPLEPSYALCQLPSPSRSTRWPIRVWTRQQCANTGSDFTCTLSFSVEILLPFSGEKLHGCGSSPCLTRQPNYPHLFKERRCSDFSPIPTWTWTQLCVHSNEMTQLAAAVFVRHLPTTF